MKENLNWIVRYQDDTHIYEDGYESEQIAFEYANEAKERGFKHVEVFKKSDDLSTKIQGDD